MEKSAEPGVERVGDRIAQDRVERQEGAGSRLTCSRQLLSGLGMHDCPGLCHFNPNGVSLLPCLAFKPLL